LEGANVLGVMEGSLVGIAVGIDGTMLGNNDGRTVGFVDGSFEGIVRVGGGDGTVVGNLDGGFDGF